MFGQKCIVVQLKWTTFCLQLIRGQFKNGPTWHVPRCPTKVGPSKLHYCVLWVEYSTETESRGRFRAKQRGHHCVDYLVLCVPHYNETTVKGLPVVHFEKGGGWPQSMPSFHNIRHWNLQSKRVRISFAHPQSLSKLNPTLYSIINTQPVSGLTFDAVDCDVNQQLIETYSPSLRVYQLLI